LSAPIVAGTEGVGKNTDSEVLKCVDVDAADGLDVVTHVRTGGRDRGVGIGRVIPDDHVQNGRQVGDVARHGPRCVLEMQQRREAGSWDESGGDTQAEEIRERGG
jgi:hypothetical protein